MTDMDTDDADGEREANVPDSLDKYVPDEEAVLGDEEERQRAGQRNTEAVTTDPEPILMDHSPNSTAVSATDSEYDKGAESYSGFSDRQTYFHPSDAIDSDKYAHLSDVDDHMYDSEYPRRKRHAHRMQDLDVIEDKLCLRQDERAEIDHIVETVDLSDCGRKKFETLLLAAARFVYRRSRNETLVNGPFVTDEDIHKRYTAIRDGYDCDRKNVDVVFEHIRSEFQ